MATDTACPSRASSTAGARFRARESLPIFVVNSAHAAGAPGTVAGAQPNFGIWPESAQPRDSASFIVTAAGMGPLAFSPDSLPSFHTSAKASLPIPLAVGSTTVRAAAVATAASTALPPVFMMSRPAFAASG